MDSSIGKREQINAKKQVVEGGQESVAEMSENLESLPAAQAQSSLPSFRHHSFTDVCEADPKLQEAAKKFEAALKENITFDNYLKPMYSSLIERANRTSKIQSATSMRNTLIKSVVFAAIGKDLLTQTLGLTSEDMQLITLLPAEFLEILEILSPE